MGRKDRMRRLADLFHQADAAYRHYEREVLRGNRDDGWPEWYADYLIGHGLDILLEERPRPEMLARFLLLSKADHKSCHSNDTWEEFAAARIVERTM